MDIPYSEITHQAALVPLLACAMVLGLGKLPKLDKFLLAVALSMSWIGDSKTTSIGGELAYGYFWAPAQIIFAFAAVVGDWVFDRIAFVWALCVLVLIASYINPDPGVMLWPFAAPILLWLGRNSPVRIPLFIYFGAGTIVYMFMIQEPTFQFWLIYQACRLVALASLSVLILKNYRREPAHVVVYN